MGKEKLNNQNDKESRPEDEIKKSVNLRADLDEPSTENTLEVKSELSEIKVTFSDPKQPSARLLWYRKSLGAPLLGVLFTLIFYLLLFLFPFLLDTEVAFFMKFTDRGLIPYITVYLFFWAFSILIIKQLLLKNHKKNLSNLDLKLDSNINEPEDLKNIYDFFSKKVGDIKGTILIPLFEKLFRNLYMSRNIKDARIQLNDELETEISKIEADFTLVRVFLWAIPIFGFIGTVLGVSAAVGGFADFLSIAQELDQIKGSLTSVTMGLSDAFDSTFVALALSIVLMIITSSVEKGEKEYIQLISEYCEYRIIQPLSISLFHKKDENTQIVKIIEDLAPSIEKWRVESERFYKTISETLGQKWESISKKWFESVEKMQLDVNNSIEIHKDLIASMISSITKLQEESNKLYTPINSFINNEENSIKELFINEKAFINSAIEKQNNNLENTLSMTSEMQRTFASLIELQNKLESEIISVSGSEGLIATLSQVRKTLDNLSPAIEKLTNNPLDVNIQFVPGSSINKET